MHRIRPLILAFLPIYLLTSCPSLRFLPSYYYLALLTPSYYPFLLSFPFCRFYYTIISSNVLSVHSSDVLSYFAICHYDVILTEYCPLHSYPVLSIRPSILLIESTRPSVHSYYRYHPVLSVHPFLSPSLIIPLNIHLMPPVIKTYPFSSHSSQ